MFSKSHGKTFVTESNKTRSSSTQQRASTGRFAALINNNAIINTDQDDFLPSTQTQTKSIKRKSAPSSTYVKPVEPTKRTKKSNLFQDVVSTSHLTLYENTIKPIPPWLNLPFEILQHIFSFIPVKSLLTQVARVCRQWNSAINDEKFVRWAKIYLRYQYEETSTLKMIEQMLNRSGDDVLHTILQRVASILTDSSIDVMTIHLKFSPSILRQLDRQLRLHPLFPFAADLLTKTKCENEFQLKIFDEKIFNPFCLTTAICILSENVTTVRHIFRLWLNIEEIRYEFVMDFFYFLLTLFTGATRLHHLQFRFSYRLFYCLKENEDEILSKFNSISQHILQINTSYTIFSNILSKLMLTAEQQMIVCYNLENRQTMKINAFAGTGKTTTLIAYAAKRMDESFLYIAYNKAIQTHAEKVFPPNVKCQTIHSLAYAKIGFDRSLLFHLDKTISLSIRFSRQYEGFLGNLRLKSIVDLVQDRPLIGEKGRTINSIYIRARFVYNALNNFIASADSQVTDEHVENGSSDQSTSQVILTTQEKLNLAADGNFIWSIMKMIRDTRVLMTHDGYLKLYQLSKPQIQFYDCLFVDEAQDLTPAVTDIINNQRVSKILVGDKHQQIYAFRGAVNAMTKIDSTVTFYLTKSFRFGYEIAFLSNLILQNLCDEKKFLIGNSKTSFIDGRSASNETIDDEQKAFLFRTNFNLFNCAVQLIIERDVKNVAFVGGNDAMGFDKILDVFYLWLDPEERRKKNYQIRDPQLQTFNSFKTFEKFSTDVADGELLGKIKLVQMHGHSIIDKIKQLQMKSCSDLSKAKILLSTAHKAKGLEFPIVILADDFVPRSGETSLDQISFDEHRENLNILYVAATRATKELVLNVDLFYLLYKMCREPFYRLSFSSNDIRCSSCAIDANQTSTMKKNKEILFQFQPIQLSSNIRTAGDFSPLPICVKHLPSSFISICQLYHSI